MLRPGASLRCAKKGGVFAVVNAMNRVARHAQSDHGSADAMPSSSVTPRLTGSPLPVPYIIPSLKKLATQLPQDSPTPDGNPGHTLENLQQLLSSFVERELAQRVKAAQARLTDASDSPLNTAQPPADAEDFDFPTTSDDPATTAPPSKDDVDSLCAALSEALMAYNPTLDPHVVHRVAERLRLQESLKRARDLRDVLQRVGTQQFTDSVLYHWKLKCRRERESEGPRALQRAEEEAGIVGHLSLSQGGRRQKQRLTAFVRHASDFQVNEVLPSGRVVTFTEATNLPDGARLPQELAASVKAALQPVGGKHDKRDVRTVFLHFVLYRDSVPLAEAFKTLADFCSPEETASDVVKVSDTDFAVNAPMDDTMVAVQTGSLRVVLPPHLAPLEERERCRRLSRQLARVNTVEQGQRPRLQVQFLGWRKFPCSAKFGALCHSQYATMLRGLLHHSGHLEAVAFGAGQCVPNFFGRDYFGPVGCPFRHYDICAAVEMGRFSEAALMAVVITCWTGLEDSNACLPRWAAQMLQLLAGDEDRAGVWRQHFHLVVPVVNQERAKAAKGALLWNVVVSSRVSLLSGSNQDELLVTTPEAGDFVLCGRDASKTGPIPGDSDDVREAKRRLPRITEFVPVLVKPELLPDAQLSHSFDEVASAAALPSTIARAVAPIFSTDEAAPFSLLDVVAPVGSEGTGEALEMLATELGFPSPRHTKPAGNLKSSFPGFRPIFVSATGFPRTAKPWAKEFIEPASTQLPDDTAAPAEYKLSTDVDLASATGGSNTGSSRRDYAEKSRGHQPAVWPIGKRGRGIGDRLPPGLLASAALSHAGPNVSSAAQRNVSKCLVLHFTLPVSTYCGSFMRELGLVENRCLPQTVPTFPMEPPRQRVNTSRPRPSSGEITKAKAPQFRGKKSGGLQDSQLLWSEGNILSLSRARGQSRSD